MLRADIPSFSCCRAFVSSLPFVALCMAYSNEKLIDRLTYIVNGQQHIIRGHEYHYNNLCAKQWTYLATSSLPVIAAFAYTNYFTIQGRHKEYIGLGALGTLFSIYFAIYGYGMRSHYKGLAADSLQNNREEPLQL